MRSSAYAAVLSTSDFTFQNEPDRRVSPRFLIAWIASYPVLPSRTSSRLVYRCLGLLAHGPERNGLDSRRTAHPYRVARTGVQATPARSRVPTVGAVFAFIASIRRILVHLQISHSVQS